MTQTPRVPYERRRSRNGRTIREAAALTGLTEQTIKRWTSEPREVYVGRARTRQDAIREWKTQHPTHSMRRIAEQFGCAVGTVHRALKADNDGENSAS